MSSKILLTCACCGTEFYRYKSQIVSQDSYCSRSCAAKVAYKNRAKTPTQSLTHSNKNRQSLSVLAKKEAFKKRFPEIFDESFIRHKYVELGYSVPEMAKEVGCSETAIKSRLKEFGIPIKSIAEIKGSSRYLNKCSGSGNHRWMGGSMGDYRGKDWHKMRTEARIRDRHTCQMCGSKSSLSVHHIVPYRFTKDNSLDNLITLCVSCHATQDGKIISLFKRDIGKFKEALGLSDEHIKEAQKDVCEDN